jgi:D-3-phosphoglycerate dehydrogenase
MKILIADKIQEEAIYFLRKEGISFDQRFNITKTELQNEIEKYDGIIIRSRTKLTSEILERAYNLKVIGRAGSGLDNVDLQKAKEKKIKVFNTPKAAAVSVAELTIGLMICLARKITKADKTLHCGTWSKDECFGFTLEGKKLGLIGFGNIGQEVATRAESFGMKIGIFDVDFEVQGKAEDSGYKVFSSLEDLIVNSEFISLHLPSLPETENIINKKIIDMMNSDTFIINTARGTLIDEEALISALKLRKIGGAALDVYRQEPLNNVGLCNCEDNLILTPHIGSQTLETQSCAGMMIVQEITNYIKNYNTNHEP